MDRVGIGDLDGDGLYDFVVKHPAGNVDPGRRVPSTDTYKIDPKGASSTSRTSRATGARRS